MARTYDDEIYLFGALFHGYDTDEGRIFDWHTKSDLTQVDELTGKIRPIPSTPVMVNALRGLELAMNIGEVTFFYLAIMELAIEVALAVDT